MAGNERHLAGKSVWVTGSSRGIGRVVAEHLARLGARVAVHGTTPHSTRAFNEAESLAAVAEAIAARQGVETLAVHGDLSQEQEVKRVVAEVRDRFGGIDILVNCAGGDIGAEGTGTVGAGRPDRNDALHISARDLVSVLDRNLMTCIWTCREVAPEMIERRAGHIVNFGSVAGLVGAEEGAIYATAKAAVTEYSRCLAAQLRPHNVTVNVVAPGTIVTARIVASRQVDMGRLDEAGRLDRYGQPIEIARAVAFLVSDDNTYITGQVLRVDGGDQLWPA
ncbi:MAG TPA: 3-oxoacyl-ACP reductase [Propionibacteriaceae bacterium]|nr:3-oxoacyl-ACP reductase [Propionibacteriaceae bacterium]